VRDLTPDHEVYLRQLAVTGPPEVTEIPRVRVIDSGCSGAQNVVLKRNLLDPGRVADVADDHGHGSLVAAIIDDIVHVPFEIFKVADASRQPTEWEILQALSISPVPPIVNLSMSLGFGRGYCSQCGRRPVGARTAVFQERLRELEQAGVIVVVAAGNQAAAQLAYPSRFASTVAVQAWAGQPPSPADYSNTGASDETGTAHSGVFVCPGGKSDGSEGPALEQNGKLAYGTSFAAAYMSGILARTWASASACSGPCPICSKAVLDRARVVASREFPGYDQHRHGNGLARQP
jgi:hypothetical protein